jgi:SAM-dependent methyltransferase
VYRNPEYYEIAFSFRDSVGEVDVFEECIRRHSQIPVKSVLELGCGNCPHMKELIGRGYSYTGIDNSKAMIDYSSAKAENLEGVNLVLGDMIDFSVPQPVDFVFILLGSLYATGSQDLSRHFESVGNALEVGGLYFLDWCVQFDIPWASEGSDSWELERDGTKVKTTVTWRAANPIEQTFVETITLDVDDRGKKRRIVGEETKKAIFPEEFLCLVSQMEGFEFVGWWNNWDLSQPLRDQIKVDRPIALLRRVRKQAKKG